MEICPHCDWPFHSKNDLQLHIGIKHPDKCKHRRTEEIGDQENGYPGGDIIKVKCMDCGKTFRVELPQ